MKRVEGMAMALALPAPVLLMAAGLNVLGAQMAGSPLPTLDLDPDLVGEYAPAGEGLPLYRPAGSVAVLAVATEEWLPVPTHPMELKGNYQFIPDEVARGARGQLFELLEAEGGWDPSRGRGEFVAAPWTLGCGCAEVGWQEPTWVEPGDTVAFLLTPTRISDPGDGPVVFDVLGWDQPYPAGDFIPFWRTRRQPNPDWLGAREFFEFLQALPTGRAVRLDPGSALDGLRSWLREHPDRRDAFPVPSVLEVLGEASRAEQGSSWTGLNLRSRAPAPGELARVLIADRVIRDHGEDASYGILVEAARARERIWQFREAVDLYEKAAAARPGSFEPPLQQGHRLLRLREPRAALDRLTRARELDPTGFNTAYIRGLTLYVMGDFQGAADEYLRCLARGDGLEGDAPEGDAPGRSAGDPRQCSHTAADPASRVAITAWAVRALRRAGRDEEASRLLAGLPDTVDEQALQGPLPDYADSPIVPGDNRHYWALLRYYRGDLPVEDLLDRKRWGPQWATVAYGVAAWWIAEGEGDRARTLLKEIVSDPNWARFGHVAAEADLVRLDGNSLSHRGG